MVGAGVAMLLDTSRDRRLVAPDDERVDEAIAAAAGDVVVGEALPLPVVGVVREPEIGLEVKASDLTGSRGVALEHDALLTRHEAIGTDATAAPRPSDPA